MNREGGAVEAVQVDNHFQADAHGRLGAPPSRSARVGRAAIPLLGNVLEQPSEAAKPECGKRDAGRGGSDWALPAVMYPVQPPAHSGAGGPVRNSEAGRGEPETLESVLAAVGGA